MSALSRSRVQPRLHHRCLRSLQFDACGNEADAYAIRLTSKFRHSENRNIFHNLCYANNIISSTNAAGSTSGDIPRRR